MLTRVLCSLKVANMQLLCVAGALLLSSRAVAYLSPFQHQLAASTARTHTVIGRLQHMNMQQQPRRRTTLNAAERPEVDADGTANLSEQRAEQTQPVLVAPVTSDASDSTKKGLFKGFFAKGGGGNIKQKLASLGLYAVLSYGFVSNFSYAICVW